MNNFDELLKGREQPDQDLIGRLAAMHTKANGTDARVTGRAPKMVRAPGDDAGTRGSLGQQITRGKEASLSELGKARGRLSMETKAIISSLATDANGSAGDLRGPAYV